MDEELRQACRTVCDMLREKHHHTAKVMIDGNYRYEMVLKGKLYAEDEMGELYADGSIHIIPKDC